ncbi:MAG: hypothetical protein ACFFD6_05645 [Candidatus Thorarchaeota archaeon]
MHLNVVQSTPSEAWNRKMPPIGFSVDYSRTAMIAEKFPEPDYYLRISRPPNGSMEFLVKAYREEKHDHNTLRSLVQDFSLQNGATVDIGRTDTIRIDDIDRRAREFLTGRGLSRKKWKAAIIPSPDGGPYGLLVIFGLYVGSGRDGKRFKLTNHPVFKKLTGSFRLTNGR